MPRHSHIEPMHRHVVASLTAVVALAMVVAGGSYAAAKPMPTAPTTTTMPAQAAVSPATTIPPPAAAPAPAPAATTTIAPPAAAPAAAPAPPVATTIAPPAAAQAITTTLPPTTPPPTTATPTTPPTTTAPDTIPSTTQAPGTPDTTAPPTTDAPPPVNPEAAAAAAAQGDGGPAADAPRLSSAAVDAAIASLQRSGASSTQALMEALAPLSQFGLSPTDAAIKGMGKFPVAGLATWTDSWLAPRSNPTPHPHQGNDIFATFGTPVRAPSDGTVRFGEEPSGGKAAYVTEPGGTYYFMCHLEGFAPDLQSGDTVTQGQVVGFNGDTGNAKGGAPHVHFEIHPGGGGAVDPKPTLDRWLAEALAAAPALVASYQRPETPIPQVLISTGELRRFDVAAPIPTGPALFVRLAEAAEKHTAMERSIAALLPVTPRGLASLLREPLAY